MGAEGRQPQERSTVQILRAARERISDPERWMTGVEALTADGHVVDGDHPEAVRWCVAGAVKAEGGDARCNPVAASLEARLIQQAIGRRGIGPWNDQATHAEVMAALDRAVDLAEASTNSCRPAPKKSPSGLGSPSRSSRRRSATCSAPASLSSPSSTCDSSKAVTNA